MATRVVGDDVDVDVDTYGSIYDEERLVPSGITVDPPSSSPPSWKTKKLMYAGLLGMTAAVASSALLFYSIRDVSNQASIGSSFLVHDRGGVKNDNTCYPASGLWTAGSTSYGASNVPHQTCFIFQEGENYCFSNSYYDDGDWKPCTPNGAGWSIYSPGTVTLHTDDGDGYAPSHTTSTVTLSPVASGTGCTAFSKDVPS